LLLTAAARAATPPNVIFILADDMAPGDIAAFNGGKTRTPAIDRLAKEGVWFDSAYSASAVCSPARAALLTGRYPQRTGVVSLEMNTELELTRLKLDETTIADVFTAGGYKTGLIGKWHTGAGPDYHPLKRGFAEFEGFFGSDKMTFYEYTMDVKGVRSAVKDKYLTDDLSERAIGFVQRHAKEPFFLFLAHYAPHRPLNAPEAAVKAYMDRGFNKNTATIYAMIEIMDRGIGELVAELDRLKLRENTLIVFASDNGPDPIPGERFNLGLRGTKYEIHEGGLRVPLIFNWPAKFKAGERSTLVHFTDMFPTLVELCGLKVPAKALPRDGASIVPVLTGGAPALPAARFWQWNRNVPNYTHNAAMREGPWKLVRPYVTRNNPEGDSAAVPVLYRMPTDPGETTDLAQEEPERYARMKAALEAWSAEVERERTRK
ncbi:MAG: arylsulfatase, partial [Verrucomicrobiota bacterium]